MKAAQEVWDGVTLCRTTWCLCGMRTGCDTEHRCTWWGSEVCARAMCALVRPGGPQHRELGKEAEDVLVRAGATGHAPG